MRSRLCSIVVKNTKIEPGRRVGEKRHIFKNLSEQVRHLSKGIVLNQESLRKMN